MRGRGQDTGFNGKSMKYSFIILLVTFLIKQNVTPPAFPGAEGGGKFKVGGWPELKSLIPLQDSDKGGMPDNWEKQNILNPLKADNNLYALDEYYTNLEVYINSLVTKK